MIKKVVFIFGVRWPITGRTVTQWPCWKQSKSWRWVSALQPLLLRSEMSLFWRIFIARDFLKFMTESPNFFFFFQNFLKVSLNYFKTFHNFSNFFFEVPCIFFMVFPLSFQSYTKRSLICHIFLTISLQFLQNFSKKCLVFSSKYFFRTAF